MLIALIGYVCSYIVVLCIHSCVKELNLPNATVSNTDSDDNTDGDESKSDMLNIADSDGHTALHLACLNGHFSVVSYPCTCDADLEAWYVCHYYVSNRHSVPKWPCHCLFSFC